MAAMRPNDTIIYNIPNTKPLLYVALTSNIFSLEL